MIKNYRDKRTEYFARGNFKRAFQGFSQQAEKQLKILNAAESTEDLAALPNNRFEALSRDRAGQFAIRINWQWRICFEWPEDDPEYVEIVDYH